VNDRSLLYVPGDRPDRFDRAAGSGSDAIILDLEDGVALDRKHDARAAVSGWLATRAQGGPSVWVRVNNTALLEPDVRAAAGADGIYLPKASVADLGRLETTLPVTALIETAQGVLDARAIAAHPQVARTAIGEADLGAELGMAADAGTWSAVRALVVLASAAAGIESPVGPVSTDFRDLDGLRASTEGLERAGFGGRAAIHPAQVPVINAIFTPTDAAIAAARDLLARFEAAGGGVCVDDRGRMVDEAVVRAARRTLARAR